MVSNLVVEIAIYNFDLFHYTLISIPCSCFDITHIIREGFRNLKISFGSFFLRIESVLSMLRFEISGICDMIVSITVSSITPLVASLPFCLLISLRSSLSESIFLTLRITVVLFWRLTFLECLLWMCFFKFQEFLKISEHSLHRA